MMFGKLMLQHYCKESFDGESFVSQSRIDAYALIGLSSTVLLVAKVKVKGRGRTYEIGGLNFAVSNDYFHPFMMAIA